jgi:hypothetical protein
MAEYANILVARQWGWVGMSNLHRIMWIDAQTRSGTYPNTQDIAGHFEISSRQAARDIEYMRDTLGAPLVYDHVHRGYRYEGETFVLPFAYLNAEQHASLVNITERFRNSQGRSEQDMAELFTRLLSADRNGSVTRGRDTNASLPAMTMDETGFNVVFEFEAVGAVDFRGLDAKTVGPTVNVQFPDYQSFLLFVTNCPVKFAIKAPSWIKLKARKNLEQTLESLK